MDLDVDLDVDLDIANDPDLPFLPVSRLQYIHPPIQPPLGYVNSGTIIFGSSNPLIQSNSLGNISDISYISAGGVKLEDKTV